MLITHSHSACWVRFFGIALNGNQNSTSAGRPGLYWLWLWTGRSCGHLCSDGQPITYCDPQSLPYRHPGAIYYNPPECQGRVFSRCIILNTHSQFLFYMFECIFQISSAKLLRRQKSSVAVHCWKYGSDRSPCWCSTTRKRLRYIHIVSVLKSQYSET